MGHAGPSERLRVLKNNEIRQFGECRKQRQVLEGRDRLLGDGRPDQFDSCGDKVS